MQSPGQKHSDKSAYAWVTVGLWSPPTAPPGPTATAAVAVLTPDIGSVSLLRV